MIPYHIGGVWLGNSCALIEGVTINCTHFFFLWKTKC